MAGAVAEGVNYPGVGHPEVGGGRVSAERTEVGGQRPVSSESSRRLTKTDLRLVRFAERLAETEALIAEMVKAEIGVVGKFVTRRGLAALLQVSVRTVDEAVAAKEITPVRILGRVRFYVPHVVMQLTAAAIARLEELEGTTGVRTLDCGLGGNLGQEIEQENAETTEGGQHR